MLGADLNSCPDTPTYYYLVKKPFQKAFYHRLLLPEDHGKKGNNNLLNVVADSLSGKCFDLYLIIEVNYWLIGVRD
jgi:hypothetical protein